MPSDIPNSRSGPLDGITVVASGDHVACDLDGDAVILHLSTGTYFGLNAVASQVWKLIQCQEIIRILTDCDQAMKQRRLKKPAIGLATASMR
jgi:hypothetical protein